MKCIDNNKGEAHIVTHNYYCTPQCKAEFVRLIEKLEEKELHIVGLTDILELQAKSLERLIPGLCHNIIYDNEKKEFIRGVDEEKIQLNLFEEE